MSDFKSEAKADAATDSAFVCLSKVAPNTPNLGLRFIVEKTHCSAPKAQPPATFPHPYSIWCTEAVNLKAIVIDPLNSPARFDFVRIALFDVDYNPIVHGLKSLNKELTTYLECEFNKDAFCSPKFGVGKTSSEIFGCLLGEFPSRQGGLLRLGFIIGLDNTIHIHYLPEFWSVSKLPLLREENPMWRNIATHRGFNPNAPIHLTCKSRSVLKHERRKTGSKKRLNASPYQKESPQLNEIDVSALIRVPEPAYHSDEKDTLNQNRFTYEADFTDYCKEHTFRLKTEAFLQLPPLWYNLFTHPSDAPTSQSSPTRFVHTQPGVIPVQKLSPTPLAQLSLVNPALSPTMGLDLFSRQFDPFWDKIHKESEIFFWCLQE